MMQQPVGPSHDHHHHNNHEHGRGLWAAIRHAVTPHSHDHSEAIQSAEESSEQGLRAAWFSLGGMGATAVLQIVIVTLSGSMALLADTVHNIGHLATTIPLIIAFRIGQRAPTRRYTYGFRRAEDLVGLLIGLVIALSAAVIIWESVRALAQPRELTNLGWVLAAALVGAAGNEAVAQYRIRVGRRIGSAALIAEGQHARTDALTSLAVVSGVVGAWLGAPQVDAVAGLAIAAVVVLVLIRSMKTVLNRLMDGVDESVTARIGSVAERVAGVHAVEGVRARWSGHRLEAELGITIDGGQTVTAGHLVAETLQRELLGSVPHLDRVAVRLLPVAEGTGGA
ncbi:cation diffusion facilitator family transporter [Citricoccus nitrophenolicus]|uniref:cation diffusion facilitator family transporter n=1 Tax=Citricoccus nitrophenolicus TaxID=863575 RepID=UPI0031EBF2DF